MILPGWVYYIHMVLPEQSYPQNTHQKLMHSPTSADIPVKHHLRRPNREATLQPPEIPWKLMSTPYPLPFTASPEPPVNVPCLKQLNPTGDAFSLILQPSPLRYHHSLPHVDYRWSCYMTWTNIPTTYPPGTKSNRILRHHPRTQDRRKPFTTKKLGHKSGSFCKQRQRGTPYIQQEKMHNTDKCTLSYVTQPVTWSKCY